MPVEACHIRHALKDPAPSRTPFRCPDPLAGFAEEVRFSSRPGAPNPPSSEDEEKEEEKERGNQGEGQQGDSRATPQHERYRAEKQDDEALGLDGAFVPRGCRSKKNQKETDRYQDRRDQEQREDLEGTGTGHAFSRDAKTPSSPILSSSTLKGIRSVRAFLSFLRRPIESGPNFW